MFVRDGVASALGFEDSHFWNHHKKWYHLDQKTAMVYENCNNKFPDTVTVTHEQKKCPFYEFGNKILLQKISNMSAAVYLYDIAVRRPERCPFRKFHWWRHPVSTKSPGSAQTLNLSLKGSTTGTDIFIFASPSPHPASRFWKCQPPPSRRLRSVVHLFR